MGRSTSSDAGAGSDTTEALLGLAVEVTRDDWWGPVATRRNDAALLGHSFETVRGVVHGQFTVTGPSRDATDRVVRRVRDSPRTASVERVPRTDAETGVRGAVEDAVDRRGRAHRDLLVRWEASDGRTPGEDLLAHGFLPRGPCRVRNGREEWTVLFRGERRRIRSRLEGLERATGAETRVRRVSSRAGRVAAPGRLERLTPRQREVFRLACDRGYYGWPRDVSAAELADELCVTRATVSEHLRTAEARLFAPLVER